MKACSLLLAAGVLFVGCKSSSSNDYVLKKAEGEYIVEYTPDSPLNDSGGQCVTKVGLTVISGIPDSPDKPEAFQFSSFISGYGAVFAKLNKLGDITGSLSWDELVWTQSASPLLAGTSEVGINGELPYVIQQVSQEYCLSGGSSSEPSVIELFSDNKDNGFEDFNAISEGLNDINVDVESYLNDRHTDFLNGNILTGGTWEGPVGTANPGCSGSWQMLSDDTAFKTPVGHFQLEFMPDISVSASGESCEVFFGHAVINEEDTLNAVDIEVAYKELNAKFEGMADKDIYFYGIELGFQADSPNGENSCIKYTVRMSGDFERGGSWSTNNGCFGRWTTIEM